MNNRIKELAKIAGYNSFQEKTRSGDTVEFDDFKAFDLEKFAELLINECVKMIQINRDQGPSDDYDGYHAGACDSIELDIKNHFGVSNG